MKISGKKIPLQGGDYNYAFEIIEDAPVVADFRFYNWCVEHGFEKHFKVGTYYTAEMFGDIDHDAILVKKKTPLKFITALLLAWT